MAEEDIVDQEVLLKELGIAPEQLGMAASELEDIGLVKLLKTLGQGVAGFSALRPNAYLFIVTDPILQRWNPEQDARALAATMINIGDGHVSLAQVDQMLNWGPRRLNPAAEYLASNSLVRPAHSRGSLPYVYSSAAVTNRTRRFAEGS